MPVINVAIAGLGRSGWDIHAKTLKELPSLYRIVAVTDSDSARCKEAVDTFGCRAYGDFDAMIADPEVELAIIATPSHVHAEQTIAALSRGKHVVCEKPMALSSADADRMIAATNHSKRLLTVFHNMRYWPDFLKVREVIASGTLGRIVQVKITMHRFARRWDWQTVRAFGGGALFNGGAHLTDLALQLLLGGDDDADAIEPIVSADLQRALAAGDAEDHVKILLRSPRADARVASVEVEVTNACAYPQDTWHVMGTAGGLRGSHDRLEWKWADFSELPERRADELPSAADRRFNREELRWQQASWTKDSPENADYRQFHEDVHHSIRNGTFPRITPQSVRRTIATLERCRTAAAAAAGTTDIHENRSPQLSRQPTSVVWPQ